MPTVRARKRAKQLRKPKSSSPASGDDDSPPRVNRPFRHYPVWPEGPITADEIDELLREHKRKYPDVDASSESEESGTECESSEDEVEEVAQILSEEVGISDSDESLWGGPFELRTDEEIENAMVAMLGPNAWGLLAQHLKLCPISPRPLFPVVTTPSIDSKPVSNATPPTRPQTNAGHRRTVKHVPGLPAEQEELSRLRPKDKLKLTPRAKKTYRA